MEIFSLFQSTFKRTSYDTIFLIFGYNQNSISKILRLLPVFRNLIGDNLGKNVPFFPGTIGCQATAAATKTKSFKGGQNIKFILSRLHCKFCIACRRGWLAPQSLFN